MSQFFINNHSFVRFAHLGFFRYTQLKKTKLIEQCKIRCYILLVLLLVAMLLTLLNQFSYI